LRFGGEASRDAEGLSAMAQDFIVNESRNVAVSTIGHERQNVIVIDDLLRTPEALIAYVTQAVTFRPPGNHYPGLRGEPMPKPYAANLIRALGPLIGETFGVSVDGPVSANFYFGLATVAPASLTVAQRLPHFDTTNPNQIALLHYLCDGAHGGTAFFRHRATGFETITEARKDAYFGTLRGEIQDAAPQARYAAGDDRLFEEAAAFEASFNRLLIYRSAALHSGRVGASSNLSADPRRGRLTANLFLAFG
jgi:hypothetical protein